jgi:glycosyltransferase involved in cell wall biosynthesis
MTGFATLQIGLGWFPEEPGGINRIFYHLSHLLPQLGCGFDGCVCGTGNVSVESHGSVQAFAPPSDALPRRLAAARHLLLECLSKRPPNVIASHFALFAFPALDRLARFPLVVHFHGPWAAEVAVEGGARWRAALQRRIETAVYARARRFIVLSQSFARELAATYGADESLIDIIPGGVDVDFYSRQPQRCEARLVLGWPTDRPVILSVRRLVHRMGLSHLFEAMRTVVRQVPEALLVVAGDGPLRQPLAAAVEELGLCDNIRLLGRISDEDLALAYRAADLTIVPTVALEGFGLPVIESLAAGTPALATPVGGLPEALSSFSPDLVLAGTGPEAIAEALTDALLGRRPMPNAESCIAYARRRFDWPVIARQVSRVYQEAA